MAKSSYYFDHDYNARNDQKILELRAEYGWEGYGIFYGIIEVLCESDGKIKRGALGGLSLGLSVAKPELIKLIDFMISIELLFEVDGIISSKRVNDHLEFRTMLSEAGKRGGRPSKKPPLSPAKAPPKAGKESKEEESKVKESKIEMAKSKLRRLVSEYTTQYDKVLIEKFYDYWTEPTKSGTKCKYELERTWDTGRRLARWFENEDKFKKPIQNGTRQLQFEPKIPTI